MAARWTDADLDAELARRVEAQDRIAAALVELENHPGHRLLEGVALTGTSARRWEQVRELLPRLWADLAVHRTTVAAACAARTRRPRPGEREWTELQQLLVERSVEVGRTEVALRDRGLAGAREEVRTTTLAELADGMDTAFRELVEVVETAEAVHLAALAGLGPLAERLREARSRAGALLDPADPDVTALADLTEAVDVRLGACADDPLAHAGRRPADLAADVDGRLGAVEARLATLVAVRDSWPRQRGEVASAVAALDGLWEQEARARRAAQGVVADTGLAAPRDPRPALHRRLAALPGPAARPGPGALAALPVLASDTAHAAATLRAAVDRAAGLTERRGELSGRFAAYRAKAVRLGVAEDPEVVALAERVRALLDSGPADLRALTPALVAFQRRVGAEEGRVAMTGPGRAPGGTAGGVGIPCGWSGCAGALEADGFCDTCGRTPPGERATPGGIPVGRGPATARIAPDRGAPLRAGTPPAGTPPAGTHRTRRARTEPRRGTAPARVLRRPHRAPAAPPPGTAPAAGRTCGWPGCDGTMEADGFCDTCGRTAPTGTAPAGPGTAPAGGPATGPTGSSARWSGRLSTGPTGSRSLRSGSDADIPPVPRIDPLSALLADPQVPEPDRFCRFGGSPHPVGRSRNGRPGQLRGFCPQDGTPYSFAPPLRAGTLVAGQYEVKGALAHGGLGWIYLAVDRNVDDRWVVLKGVLNADDPAALAAARAERQFLAQLNHPGIVGIHNFVRHVDTDGVEADYIVMAYIGGATLAQVWRTPVTDPAQRVTHALTSMIKVLPALGYLHAEGHVYCDLKPDNVMQCERRLTLIDMGAVARMDDADAVVYGTVGYHAPEVVHGELSPASDIYTVGRTLAVLALDMEPAGAGGTTALPESHPMLLRHESLHRLLLRATHTDPRCRFGSAEEMVEQLEGVRREVLAVKDGRPRPAVSAVFLPPADAFAPDLLMGPDGPGRPTPAVVAGLLPQPVVEPDDPVADALAAVGAGRPLPAGCAVDWRVDWARAVRALGAGDLDAARAGFDALYTTFPGELAPPLALGATAECAGDDDVAQHYYTQVATVDPSWADAAFGLARTRLRGGSRPAAVAALHAVPSGSRSYVAAQLAAVEATLSGWTGSGRTSGSGGPVDENELRAAADRVERLTLDPITTLRMRVAVLDAALDQVPPSTHPNGTPPPVLGCEWKERPLRFALERSLRDLARLTPDAAERVALVDRANGAHPRTLR